MSADIEAHLATLENALKGIVPDANAPFQALDALAAELERLQNKLNTDSQNFELEARKAELERLRSAEYMAERWPDKAIALKQRAETAEAELERVNLASQESARWAMAQSTRLDKALAALREIAAVDWLDGEDRFAGPDDYARAAIKEIEGETT